MSPPDRDDRTKAEFASRKFAWTEALCLDTRLSAYRKTVGIILLAMVNQSDGYAWPSLATLAALSNGSEKAARDAINDLERLGYLRTQRGGGRIEGKRGITSRFWPIWVSSKSPVTDALRERRSRLDDPQPPPQSEGSDTAEPPPQRNEPPPCGAINPHCTVAQTLEVNPCTIEPSAEPNGSGARQLAPSSSRVWKGSDGEPLANDFPDSDAMNNARWTLQFEGVQLDLDAERRAFRSHHFAVRCLQRDWLRSWEIWIEHAITREQAAA